MCLLSNLNYQPNIAEHALECKPFYESRHATFPKVQNRLLKSHITEKLGCVKRYAGTVLSVADCNSREIVNFAG